MDLNNVPDREVEEELIKNLIRLSNTIMTAIKIGRISDSGVSEFYDIFTSFRRAIHHEYEEKLSCGCHERREKGEL